MRFPIQTANLPLIALLRDRRVWLGSFGWVCLLLILTNLGVARFRDQMEAEQRDNLLQHAPQLENSSEALAGVQYDLSTGNDLNRYWPAIPDATRQPLVIICGMSQMNAINEYQPGQKIIAELMDDELAPLGTRVFGLNAGNLCNEEALFLLQAAVTSPQTKPKVFIYAVCFDKFRNIDLRSGYRTFLLHHRDVGARLAETAVRAMESHPLAATKIQRTLSEIEAESKQVADDNLESKLRKGLSDFLPLVAMRQQLNANVQTRLFFLRNWLFQIKPTSKRAIIEGRYRMNQEFFQEMIQLCRSHGVTFAAYVVPLNPQAENPYLPEQYAEFKRWIEEVCVREQVPFANFEDVVPAEHWGTYLGGPDFKHFKAEGHSLTARAVIDRFSSLFVVKQGEPAGRE